MIKILNCMTPGTGTSNGSVNFLNVLIKCIHTFAHKIYLHVIETEIKPRKTIILYKYIANLDWAGQWLRPTELKIVLFKAVFRLMSKYMPTDLMVRLYSRICAVSITY